MGVIFTPNNMTWQRQKCVHTHTHIMPYHTENVYYDCCAKCQSINIPDQETDDQYPDTSPSIRFHIYHLIARCTKHCRLPLTGKECCCKCQHDTASGQ